MTRSPPRYALGRLLRAALVLAASGCATTVADVPGHGPDWLAAQVWEVDSTAVRARIVEEMGVRRDPSLLPHLVRAASSRHQAVRVAALESLAAYDGGLDHEGRDAAFVEALGDRDHAARRAAREGLTKRFRGGRRPEALVDRLVAAARDGSSYHRRLGAVKVLADVPGERIDRLLLDLAEGEGNPELRTAAIRALGTREVGEARALLHELRNASLDDRVAAAAERALSRIGDEVSDRVLAVGPIETKTDRPDLERATRSFRDLLASRLTESGLAKVVNRADADKALDELEFQDRISDDQAIELGAILEADEVVYGRIRPTSGSRAMLVLYRMDVQSQELLQSVEVSGSLRDLEALQRKAARRFIETF